MNMGQLRFKRHNPNPQRITFRQNMWLWHGGKIIYRFKVAPNWMKHDINYNFSCILYHASSKPKYLEKTTDL
jgi:hypothetical protein